MSKRNRYTHKYRFGEGYRFIESYMDLMKEAEYLTGINRYEWLRKFNEFIFNEIIPEFKNEIEKTCWEKLIEELDLYTAKKGKYGNNWKGGLSDENHKIRTCKEYKEWRTKVFQRDGFTCQICGQVGGKLNAHHIKHFSKDKNNRLNMDNGITLCEECHRLVHKVEGK